MRFCSTMGRAARAMRAASKEGGVGMKTGDRAMDVLGRIRQAADQSLARLAQLRMGSGAGGKEPAPSSGAPSYAPPEPTVGLYGDADNEHAGALPLGMLLEKSAHDMVLRRRELREQADDLVARIGDRAGGEVTLSVQAIRFVIGGVWIATALWLFLSARGVLSGDLSALGSGMPASDAIVLARTFFPLGAAGIGVAMAVAALVGFTGNGSNARVRESAVRLGQYIADTARDFDDDLTRLRKAMNDHSNPGDAVDDLSRAYVTALGAQAYFREIEFLTSEDEDAALKFKGFLKRDPGPPPAGPVFLMGFLIGAIVIAILFVPRPDLPAVAPPEIAQYPWAANLIFFGGALYAGVGVLLSAIGGGIASGAVKQARAEALDALRGAFTAREAPRPGDVVRRIEDAVDVFRARVGGRSARGLGESNHADAGRGEFAGSDDDIPPWRRRDSSAKFVDTGFQATPERWRTDAYVEKLAGEPEAKRGLLGFKKQRRD